MRFKQLLYTGLIIILHCGCGENTIDSEMVIPKIPGIIELRLKDHDDKASIAGNYISEISQDKEFYRKVINVSFICTEKILIKAYFYKKKDAAACEFQKIFLKKNTHLYLGKVKNKTIFLNFSRDELSIELEDSEIFAKCSWKNTLEGVYKKVDDSLQGSKIIR